MTTFSIDEIVPEAHSQYESSPYDSTDHEYPFEAELFQAQAILSRSDFFHQLQSVHEKQKGKTNIIQNRVNIPVWAYFTPKTKKEYGRSELTRSKSQPNNQGFKTSSKHDTPKSKPKQFEFAESFNITKQDSKQIRYIEDDLIDQGLQRDQRRRKAQQDAQDAAKKLASPKITSKSSSLSRKASQERLYRQPIKVTQPEQDPDIRTFVSKNSKQSTSFLQMSKATPIKSLNSSFSERNLDWQQNRQSKITKRKREAASAKMQECTFRPTLIKRSPQTLQQRTAISAQNLKRVQKSSINREFSYIQGYEPVLHK